jgi:hypothetical protein
MTVTPAPREGRVLEVMERKRLKKKQTALGLLLGLSRPEPFFVRVVPLPSNKTLEVPRERSAMTRHLHTH